MQFIIKGTYDLFCKAEYGFLCWEIFTKSKLFIWKDAILV
jgi:hypothetical protein